MRGIAKSDADVIGGPGAFSIPARTFKDFNSAILTKLIREIAGRTGAGARQQAAGHPPAGASAP